VPAKYKVFRDGTLVIERWSGRVTHEEMIRHLMRRMHDSSIEPGASVLADGRSATFETPEELATTAANVHEVPGDRMRDSRVAMIVDSNVLVRANLFAREAARHGLSIMVFEHFDVGCLWLDVKPSDASRMLDLLEGESSRTETTTGDAEG
jgi:hypothetical protein